MRRVLFLLPALLARWLLLSQFVVRARIEAWLDKTFRGRAEVRWAVLWPDFDATAFGVKLETAHHRLEASRIVVGLKPLAFFGGPTVDGVEVVGLRGEFDEGEPVELLEVPATVEGALGEEAVASAPHAPPRRDPPAPRGADAAATAPRGGAEDRAADRGDRQALLPVLAGRR